MLYSSPASHQMLAREEGKAVSCAHQLIFTKCFEDEMLIIVSCASESLSSGDFKSPHLRGHCSSITVTLIVPHQGSG